MVNLSKQFPRWVYEHMPSKCYEIKPSRKLFGKQRYGFSPVDSYTVDKKYDYQSIEEAEPWLNSLNLYSEIWEIFLSGDMTRIKKMDLIISGDKPEDQEGYSDQSILANVLYYEPIKVYEALKATENVTRKTEIVKPVNTLNQFF